MDREANVASRPVDLARERSSVFLNDEAWTQSRRRTLFHAAWMGLSVIVCPLSAEAQDDGPEGVQVDLLEVPEAPPEAHPWERLVFFPTLRELDQEFDYLMLWAAQSGDIEWAGRQVARSSTQDDQSLQQQILLAEQDVAQARVRYGICRDKAKRAERLLRRYELPTHELQQREREVTDELQKAFLAQDAVWVAQKAAHLLDREAWGAWLGVYDAIAAGKWTDAWGRHRELERFHPQVLGKATLSDNEDLAFRGERLARALQAVVDLSFDGKYRAEEIQRKRYEDALAAQRSVGDCEDELYTAERFLEQFRVKRRRVQMAISQGSADALQHHASVVADRYGTMLVEVQLVDAYLSNEVWAALWWKTGVARRLAGEHDVGRQLLAQAAAVATGHRLPSGVVPPSAETWLREGENEVLRASPGTLHVVAPLGATVTVDGREVKTQLGETTASLAAGMHRLVFWMEGSDPLMRLVSVLGEEHHELVWNQRAPPAPEDSELFGEELVLPALARERKPRVVFGSVSMRGGATLGRVGLGVDGTLRVVPKWIGAQVGGALWVPLDSYWLSKGQDLTAFARIHGGVALQHVVGRVRIAGALGGYVDPLLGAGPHGLFELGWKVRRAKDHHILIIADVRGGYDVTAHFAELERWMVNGGLGIAF
jgi:hypothetical protein